MDRWNDRGGETLTFRFPSPAGPASAVRCVTIFPVAALGGGRTLLEAQIAFLMVGHTELKSILRSFLLGIRSLIDFLLEIS